MDVIIYNFVQNNLENLTPIPSPIGRGVSVGRSEVKKSKPFPLRTRVRDWLRNYTFILTTFKVIFVFL
ncbi:MAG: hypothetical protein L0Y79_07020, partial [Chlorobi bacterium]|nr:hypothetical protein [Chlorobiota bacterium]